LQRAGLEASLTRTRSVPKSLHFFLRIMSGFFQFFHYLASVTLYIPKNLLFPSTNLISLATLTSSLCLKYYGRLLGSWKGEGKYGGADNFGKISQFLSLSETSGKIKIGSISEGRLEEIRSGISGLFGEIDKTSDHC